MPEFGTVRIKNISKKDDANDDKRILGRKRQRTELKEDHDSKDLGCKDQIV